MKYTYRIYTVYAITLSYYVIMIYHDASCSTVLASTMLPATLRARPGSMATPRSWSWNKDKYTVYFLLWALQPLAFNQTWFPNVKKITLSYSLQDFPKFNGFNTIQILFNMTIWNLLEYRSWDPLHHGDLKKSPINAKLWAPARIPLSLIHDAWIFMIS